MEWKGAWSNEVDYAKGDVVASGGGSYVALKQIPRGGQVPPSDDWGVVSSPPSVTWKGPWEPTVQYKVNDVVSYVEEGSGDVASYVAVAAPPVGTVPTDRQYWEAMASNKNFEQQAWSTVEIVSTSLSAVSVLMSVLAATAAWQQVFSKPFGELENKLGSVLTDLASLANNLTSVQQAASAAQQAASTAQSTADAAKQAASTAQGAADAAKQAASTAQSTADAAKQAAGAAQSTADTAQGYIDELSKEFQLMANQFRVLQNAPVGP